MKTVRLLRPRDENWTPASLLLRYAKEHANAGYKYGMYGKIYLRLEDKFYEYHHFNRALIDDDLKQVTVYLQEVEKGEAK